MFQVDKILNNNSILAHTKNGEEYILLDKGLGFGKREKDIIDASESIKKYKLQINSTITIDKNILNRINPIYIEISSEIIRLSEQEFKEIDTNILLPLADHIAFSVSRLESGLQISNPLAKEISLLFDREYKVASKAKDIIYRHTHCLIDEDEIGYITLHIHSAITFENISDGILTARVIHESVRKIEVDFGITIDENSIDFIRLMTHMKFLLLRLKRDEELLIEIHDFIQKNYPYSYNTAKKICAQLTRELKKNIPISEISYLALHIERIRGQQ